MTILLYYIKCWHNKMCLSWIYLCVCVRNIWHIKEKTYINVIRIYMLLVQFEILKIFQAISIFAVMFIIMILN